MAELQMKTSNAPADANAARSRRLAWPAGLALAGLALMLVAPEVLPTYLVNTLIRAFLYAAVAITVDILWGFTGILTFGQSAFFGFGAYAAALVFTHAGFGPGLALAAFGITIFGAMLLALLVGWFAFHPGASPLYGSVITLVLPIAVSQLLYSGGNFTGSSSGLSGFESFDLSLEAWFRIAGVFLVAVTAGAWLLLRSDGGRILEAIRDNEQRCEYLGINVSRVKILLMMACGAIASLAGFLFACVQMVVAPEYAGFGFGTELLMWVALGGRGTLVGPLIGTLLLDTSTSYLSGSLPFLWKLLSGLAFVIVIVALPQGLLPALASAVRRAWRRGAPAPPPSSPWAAGLQTPARKPPKKPAATSPSPSSSPSC